jgi:transposase-like protein
VTSPQRAVPFYCPYCGEDHLRPFGDDPDSGHGDWRCEDCGRVFTLRFREHAGPGTA